LRLLRHHIHFQYLLLVLAEFALFVAAPFAAAMLRFAADPPRLHEVISSLWPTALILSLVMWLAMLAMGLYAPRQRARSLGIVGRIALAAAGTLFVCAALFYMLPSVLVGRGVLAIAAGLAAIGASALHLLLERHFAEELLKRRVLVYGSGRRAMPIRRLRRRSDQRGFTIVGFVRCAGDEPIDDLDRLVDPGPDLLDYCVRNRVDEIAVAMDDRRRDFPVAELLHCKIRGVEVVDLVDFLEREAGCIQLDVMNPGWLIFAGGFQNTLASRALTRIFDIGVSLVVLLLTWPLMLVAAVAIKLNDGWHAPVIYSQLRVGKNDVVFRLHKFRSMRTDAERDGKAQWAAKNDSRVTRVGAVIRKVRIDELPQIFNVLRGDMSFVGPRPERPEFVSQLERSIPYYRERHSVRPGLTGWAQLCYPYGSSEQDAAEKLKYDLFYVKNRGLLFNLMILLQTIEVIALSKGAR
jgi:sugar transferase (PEP-CTERM system associated)